MKDVQAFTPNGFIDAEFFLKKITAAKKVSRVNVTVDEINNFFYTLKCINNLDWDATEFKGRQLVDWKIDASFVDFILPAKVAVSADRTALDLIAKENLDHSKALNYSDFDDVMSLILSPFKVENTKRDTNIADCRTVVVLSDVLNRIADQEGRVLYLGVPYLPIRVNFQGYKASHYNTTVDEVTEEFIIEWTHKFAKTSS